MQNTAKRVLLSIQRYSVSDCLNSHNSALFFRLLQEDKNNLEALRMLALYSLCSEGNITEVKLTNLEKVFVMPNASHRNFFSPLAGGKASFRPL